MRVPTYLSSPLKGRGRRLFLLGALFQTLFLLASPERISAQTTYSWNSTNNNWSTPSFWTVVSGSGSTYPSTSSDTAQLNNTTANRIVTYDTGASGTLGTLSINQTSAFTNELAITRSLTVANAITLGASGGGTSMIYLEPPSTNGMTVTFNGGLLINSGGVLEAVAILNQTTLTANVTNAGGVVNMERGQQTANSVVTAISGNYIQTSGTLNLGTADLNGGTGNSTDSRFQVGGNFIATGGAINNVNAGSLFLAGVSNVITGTTISNAPGITLTTSSAVNQTLNTDAVLGALTVRSTGNSVKTVVDSNTLGTGNVASIVLFQGNTNSTTTLQLGSNLTVTGSVNSTGLTLNQTGGPYNLAINTGTNTLNILGSAFSPITESAAYVSNWTLSGTNGAGTMIASNYNFGNTNTTVLVTNGLTLTANGANGLTNSLGGGTFDSTTTFYAAANLGGDAYVSTLQGTTTNTTTLGNLKVGDGNLGTSLHLLSTTKLAGNATVASGSVLDLNGQTLALTGSGSLFGNGYVWSPNSASNGAITFVNGGISPGTSGTVGALEIDNSNITLSSTGTSQFDIASATSYDTLTLDGTFASLEKMNYSGTLFLDFLSGYIPTNGLQFNLVINGDAVISNTFTSITSNITGETFAYNPTTGVLTAFSAVPEPAPMALVAGAIVLGYALRRLRGRPVTA